MRINHIESLNAACTSVRKLAEAAIAEHRRQIALLESVGREAAALAEVTFIETEPAELQPDEMRTQAAPSPPYEAKFTRQSNDAPSAPAPQQETPTFVERRRTAELPRVPPLEKPDPTTGDILKNAMDRVDAEMPPSIGGEVFATTPRQDMDEALPTRPLGLNGPHNGLADDLKRICGIGERNERRLNGLGIFHLDQIAAWTPAEMRWVAQHLPFPERLERDDWVGQARRLVADRARTNWKRDLQEANRAFDSNSRGIVRGSERTDLKRKIMRALTG